MKRFLSLVILVFGSMWFFLLLQCDRPTEPARENTPPNTTLANIPQPGDTLFPLVQIIWDGEDSDGYIVGCEYRYTSHHIHRGDSAVFDWIASDDEILDLVFESSDSLNRQELEVRAVDNEGDKDPTPAKLTFYTPRTFLPQTEITAPEDGSALFVKEETSDWWPGILLTFQATDEDGEITEYGWAVDGGEFTWTQDTAVYITPEDLGPTPEGEHTLSVTARDNTNLVDPDPAAVTVRLVQPTFSKTLLIIDETNEDAFPGSADATDAAVDSFYHALTGLQSSWDYADQGIPPRDTLGQYQLILWHADNPLSTRPHELVNNVDILQDYASVGGDFILGGWGILKSFTWEAGFPRTFEEGTFVHDFLHINEANETALYPSDFTGAVGIGDEFSDISVQSSKLTTFPYQGKLSQVDLVLQMGGFTRPIFAYIGEESDYVGKIVGTRYYGTSFNAVVLGFPVFFIEDSDAAVLMSEIFRNMEYTTLAEGVSSP